MSNVKVFKLTTGEEIICTIDSEQPDHYIISKVRSVVPQQNQQGIAIGWGPFIWSDMSGNSGIELYKTNIVGRLLEISDAMEKEYLSKTSGIQIAGAGAIPQRR